MNPSIGSSDRDHSRGYVLITAARDEARYIEGTIRSVIAQTIRPIRWVIVSDGSTDDTDRIVAAYAAEHEWIDLVRLPPREKRHFAGKAHAVNAGLARVKTLPHAFVGNLDADVSFGQDYFEFLLEKLAGDPTLGLVGTAFKDSTLQYDYRFVSIEHVSGPCQLFRVACFEAIAGYVASTLGGVDHIAVISARMNGWRTRTFTERSFYHHRPMGSSEHGILQARFRTGVVDYALGSHPLWQLCRAAYQTIKKPYGAGALMLLAGFASASLRRVHRPVTPTFVEFHRHEQMARLRTLLVSGIPMMRRPILRMPILHLDLRAVGAFVAGVFNYVWIVFDAWFN